VARVVITTNDGGVISVFEEYSDDELDFVLSELDLTQTQDGQFDHRSSIIELGEEVALAVRQARAED
jgi:hypothetical protein